MTILLSGKNSADLVRIPLSLDGGRLNVQPNGDNEVYVIDMHLFHYKLSAREPSELRKFTGDIGRQIARTRPLNCHVFKDSSGDRQEVVYSTVELWEKIPEEFRDVYFYHEVIEAMHIAADLPQPEAHKIARAADLEYRLKYLTAGQQKRFVEMDESLITM